MRALRLVVLLATGFLVAVTLLPLIRTDEWWVRVWDFPRVQILFLALIVLALVRRAYGAMTGPAIAVAVTLGMVAAWQAWRVLPYTAVWPAEVATAAPGDRPDCFSVLIANVQMDNPLYGPALEMVRDVDADIVLLLETDARWMGRLKPVIDGYPHRQLAPQDNYYGLAFLTRLETLKSQIRRQVTPGQPSVFARLKTPGGRRFTFIGLHPEPPQVGVDSDQRDAELVHTAKIARRMAGPIVIAGDLNDVAWSHTTRLFRRISELLDPRIGRGLLPTFHADNPLTRWPLDHLFVSGHLEVRAIERLGHIGSDHFPVYAELCLVPASRNDNEEADPATEEDWEEAEEMERRAEPFAD